MPNKNSDRIFISIGVSKPHGGLDELPGAITAARRMADWAKAQGYETLLLHDGALPEITIDLLRERITDVIQDVTNQTELKRLVIFFAGHGAALAIGDQYWILTNWKKRPTEAIKVSALQRILEYYGPKQVAVIGDACQEFSAKFIDLLGSPVLDMPDEEQHPYELDQFFAVDVGKQAFMIKAKGDTQDFCLFTEVLLDALEGDGDESCFETIGTDKVVTSQSLARYLDNCVAHEAGKYGVRMIPRPKPGFYTDRIYLTLPSPSGDPIVQTDEPHSRSVYKVTLVEPMSSEARLTTQVNAINNERDVRRDAFFNDVSNATIRNHFETNCGICVSGADVADVAASFGIASRTDEQPNWFRIQLSTPNDGVNLGWSDALVMLSDGRIVSVCSIHTFVATLHIIDANSLSLFHQPIGADPYESELAINLLAQVHAGILDTPMIIDSAAMLRYGKHRIITLGCITAQFYDAIRDVESLCSMAAFYAMNNQPVPLDIILFGGGTISEQEGRLYADIPAVAKRVPRTPQEEMQRFTYTDTPKFKKHPIAGRIPWMRQAWGAVATANLDKSAAPWRGQALEAMNYLAPGAFTIATPEGHDAMFELAGITVNKGELEQYLQSNQNAENESCA